MDKLNDEYQLKYAGLVLKDMARSGSPEGIAQAVGVACEIISSAQRNPNISQEVRSVLEDGRLLVNHARKMLSGRGGAA